MKMNKDTLLIVVKDLIDENPIACSALLSISHIEFSEAVPTLAVTLEERPVLKVNPEFITEHLLTETDVKAVVLHEFLHVVLNHTERYKKMTHALNIALDAVINHIIQRTCGEAYGAFFRRYYQNAQGLTRLLVPLSKAGMDSYKQRYSDNWNDYHELKWGLATGRVITDDVLDIVNEVQSHQQSWKFPANRHFIGGHEACHKPNSLSHTTRQALERTLREMNGSGIFRSPRGALAGIPPHLANTAVRASAERRRAWERTTLKLLRDFVTPDHQGRVFEDRPQTVMLPVLNAADRRGFINSLWSPIIPNLHWENSTRTRKGSCQIYLDVSGSMNGEMAALISLLQRLRDYIRMPFWAFSDRVKPAVIEKGILKTESTGGTAMNCVLEHVARTRPGKAIVITDGYIEPCDTKLLQAVQGAHQSIFALIARYGSTRKLDESGIPCRQLPHLPEKNQ